MIYGAEIAAHDELSVARANARELENQLCRIAKAVGKDATGAPESDRTIAGATIERITQLEASLRQARPYVYHAEVADAADLEARLAVLRGIDALLTAPNPEGNAK